MKKIILIGILFFLGGCVSLSSLKTLIELGKSDKIKQKALEEETKSFLKLKEAIEEGLLKEGLSKKEVLKLYGEPVITLSRDEIEKWVYKKGQESWFGGEKIYLFFGKDSKLRGWEYSKKAP